MAFDLTPSACAAGTMTPIVCVEGGAAAGGGGSIQIGDIYQTIGPMEDNRFFDGSGDNGVNSRFTVLGEGYSADVIALSTSLWATGRATGPAVWSLTLNDRYVAEEYDPGSPTSVRESAVIPYAIDSAGTAVRLGTGLDDADEYPGHAGTVGIFQGGQFAFTGYYSNKVMILKSYTGTLPGPISGVILAKAYLCNDDGTGNTLMIDQQVAGYTDYTDADAVLWQLPESANAYYIDLSSDGLVAVQRQSDSHTLIIDLTGPTTVDLGTGISQGVFSPDGTKFLYYHSGAWKVCNVDGTGVVTILTTANWSSGRCWAPDSTQVVVTSTLDAGASQDMFMVNVDGTSPTNLTSAATDVWYTMPMWGGDTITFDKITFDGMDYLYRPAFFDTVASDITVITDYTDAFGGGVFVDRSGASIWWLTQPITYPPGILWLYSPGGGGGDPVPTLSPSVCDDLVLSSMVCDP